MSLTQDQARSLALALPDAVESSHFDHADFRRDNRIFASFPKPGEMVVKLTLEQQTILGEGEPEVFVPLPNAWGKKGWTLVRLETASEEALRHALHLAWENVAAGRKRRKP